MEENFVLAINIGFLKRSPIQVIPNNTGSAKINLRQYPVTNCHSVETTD